MFLARMVQQTLRQGGSGVLTRCGSHVRGFHFGLPPATQGPAARVFNTAALLRHAPLRPASCSAAAADVFPAAEQDPTASPLVEPHLTWPARSHGCGTVRDTDIDAGPGVTVCGWVDRSRNLGGIIFLDGRDHTGVIQVVIDPASQPEVAAAAERLRSEFVVLVSGPLRHRQDPNPRLPTGSVEIAASQLRVLNAVTRTLPFAVGGGGDEGEAPREELRLRHRVLDLRRRRMSDNLRLRHALVRCVRRHLEDDHGFIEVETPVLTRSTPEGARDYLVPSRLQAGDWYALPQSPQLFKQMLMVAGYDRYYQVGRLFSAWCTD